MDSAFLRLVKVPLPTDVPYKYIAEPLINAHVVQTDDITMQVC